jgi:hypothetical protein
MTTAVTAGINRLGTLIARYKKLFRSSPEAAILAVYGLIDLVLLLTSAEVERVKALLHALGLR